MDHHTRADANVGCSVPISRALASAPVDVEVSLNLGPLIELDVAVIGLETAADLYVIETNSAIDGANIPTDTSAVFDGDLPVDRFHVALDRHSSTSPDISVDGIQVSAVPLPASVLMLGAAIGGLGFAGRRKARKGAAAA